MTKHAWIGIDVGGTKTRLDLFDDEFSIIDSVKDETKKDAREFRTELSKAVKGLVKKAEGQAIAGIGVGFAGPVDIETGKVESAPNIPALAGFDFKKVLKEFTDGELIVYNDVHAAMYGELKLGAAVGCVDALAVFLGTGIGGAIVSNGKLHLGTSSRAGNIGNYLLQPFGPLAGSDRHGVLDEVASRVAIASAAAGFAVKEWAPNLSEKAGTDVRNIKSSDLAKAIDAGDKAVEELVRSRAHIVGIVLSNLVDFFNPEIVVLGGGLTESMPKLIREEVEAGIRAHASKDAQTGLRVVTSKLAGHAVTAGAAKLAADAD
jgi:glucokinase